MPPLHITLSRGRRLSNVPIAVEVIGDDLETKWRGAIGLGESQEIPNLAAGHYLIQVSLPAGQRLTQMCDLSEGKTENIEINVLGDSTRESLEWVKLSKPQVLDDAENREEQLRSVWLRLWKRQPDRRWSVQPWPHQVADRRPGLVQYEFRFRSEEQFAQYYLQVGGPTMQSRLITLPADDICVLITGAEPNELRDEADSILDISVTSTQHDAEVLLSYLSRGEIGQARQVSQHLIAEGLLHGKRKNPTAAAVAGYFLLETGKLNDLHQVWASNLADWITWLPDGAVIDAWYLMRKESPDFARARMRLLEAVVRGMPIYTRGLRLLLDGLALFADDPKHQGPDISAALRSAKRYAAAADWRSTITTFIGEDPDTPGKAALGKPEDPTHVIFLADVSEEDLEWRGREVTSTSRSPFNADGSMAARGPVTLADPDLERVRRAAALGEISERPELAPSDSVRDETLIVLGSDALRRYHQRESERERMRVLLEPHSTQLEPNSPERTIARFFRAADAQTQAERMFDSSPIKLAGADQPAELNGLALERIIGVSDLLSISFLERGLAAARTVAHVVARSPERHALSSATGFMVSPHLFLTNNHVIPTLDIARESYVEFDYQDGPDGRLLKRTRCSFDPDTFFVSDKELDFSLIMVRDVEHAGDFGWNRLTDEQGKILIGERLSVIQHSKNAPKQVSLRDNRVIDIVEDFLHYESDTAAPWSGAPLFNDQWEVVGIHHASVPAVDSEGNILAADGTVWNSERSEVGMRLIAHEGVRVSQIVRFLREAKLTVVQERLRDELLFLKPPARRLTAGF